MRYVWIAVIGASGAPLLYVAWLTNPLAVLLLGVEGWRERMTRVAPYRRWIAFALLVFASATAVYALRYG